MQFILLLTPHLPNTRKQKSNRTQITGDFYILFLSPPVAMKLISCLTIKALSDRGWPMIFSFTRVKNWIFNHLFRKWTAKPFTSTYLIIFHLVWIHNSLIIILLLIFLWKLISSDSTFLFIISFSYISITPYIISFISLIVYYWI